jgi:hypothetical protein
MSERHRRFRWVVEFAIDSSWVADGFEIDDERAHEMLAKAVPYAFNTEIEAKVISAPTREHVARVQGYAIKGALAEERGARPVWALEATVLDDRDSIEVPDLEKEFHATDVFAAVVEAGRLVGLGLEDTGDRRIRVEVVGPGAAVSVLMIRDDRTKEAKIVSNVKGAFLNTGGVR